MFPTALLMSCVLYLRKRLSPNFCNIIEIYEREMPLHWGLSIIQNVLGRGRAYRLADDICEADRVHVAKWALYSSCGHFNLNRSLVEAREYSSNTLAYSMNFCAFVHSWQRLWTTSYYRHYLSVSHIKVQVSAFHSRYGQWRVTLFLRRRDKIQCRYVANFWLFKFRCCSSGVVAVRVKRTYVLHI